jgi:iron complex outermembrane receptor protein
VAGGPARGRKALAQPGESLSEDVGNEHRGVNVRYRDAELLGGSLDLQAYYDDHLARFTYSSFFDAQSRIESTKQGVRLNVTTPLAGLVEGADARWGADYLHDETAQPLSDGRFFVPPMDQHSVGPFLQLQVPLGERVRVKGGVRHEQIWLDVDDFTTIEEVGGASVQGGELRYDATVFNLGFVAGLTDAVQAFGGLSQGFSVSEVGRELRTTSAESVEALSPAPKKTDGWELGLRGRWSRVHVTVSGYFNESDLGSSYGPDFRIVRTPEEIRGVEAELDVTPTDRWKLGGTLTLTEGEHDADDDGRDAGESRAQSLPAAQVLNVRGAEEDPEEAGHKGDPRGQDRTENACQ